MGIFSLAFYDEKNGIIVGGDYRNPADKTRNAAITRDCGITWTLTDEDARPYGYRSCVAYVPGTAGTTLLAVGTTGADISFDSGWSWTKVDSVGYHSIGFAASKATGWTVGSEGRVAKLIGSQQKTR